MRQPGFPWHRALQWPPLPGCGWTKGGTLLPELPHTDRRTLPDTWTNSEEPWSSQARSSGQLSERLQLPLPATETLNIKQRELICTQEIDPKRRRGAEKDR